MSHCFTNDALILLHPSFSSCLFPWKHVYVAACPASNILLPVYLSVSPPVHPHASLISKVRRLEEQLRNFDQSLKSLQASEDKVLRVTWPPTCCQSNQRNFSSWPPVTSDLWPLAAASAPPPAAAALCMTLTCHTHTHLTYTHTHLAADSTDSPDLSPLFDVTFDLQ